MTKSVFLTRIKNGVLEVDQKATLILFGSRARGDDQKDSDWDFLILTNLPDDEQTKKKFREKMFNAELEFEEPVSTLIQNKETWHKNEVTPLYQLVKREGVEI